MQFLYSYIFFVRILLEIKSKSSRNQEIKSIKDIFGTIQFSIQSEFVSIQGRQGLVFQIEYENIPKILNELNFLRNLSRMKSKRGSSKFNSEN